MRSGHVSERPTLERLTFGVGSSSSPHLADYPTPSASAYGSSGNGEGNNTRSRKRLSLDALARSRPWPTPVVTDAKSAARGTTTTTTSVMHPGTSLTDAMRGRQDPTTPTDGVDTAVLAPAFVEALMGLPEGWTLLDDAQASDALAIRSSHNKPPRRSKR